MAQTLEQFGQTIKAKYPQYNDIPDAELGQKILDKYPQYKDMVTPATIGGPTQPTMGDIRAGKAEILPGTKAKTQSAKDFAVGAWKGLGRSAVNLVKGALTISPVVGISGFNRNPVVDQTLDKASTALAPTNVAQKMGGYAETGLELAAPIAGSAEKVGSGLIKTAQDFYLSAMKPSTTLSLEERAALAKTGLSEGVKLTERGVEKMNGLIDTLEEKLGQIIKDAGEKGGKIKTASLKPMIDEVKSLYGQTVNVAESQGNVAKLDQMYNDFVQKYGEEIGTEQAQKLKTNTYKVVRDSFGELAGSVKEGMKAMARGLKEGIVANAPESEGVNKRLSSLYNFSDALEKSVKRIGNRDIISLGGKVIFSGEGITNKILAIANELFKGGAKSSVAILMDRLGQKLTASESNEVMKQLWKLAGPTGAIDLNNLIQTLGGKTVGGPPMANK